MRIPFLNRAGKPRVVPPPAGYDLWAPTYDAQPNNAVLELESRLFTELLSRVSVERKTVVDIGCGTGRHWPEILARSPSALIGVDPSRGMLERLARRYPEARVILSEGDRIGAVADQSCDLIVSTLALAHIADTARAFAAWRRILRTGGDILLTDFHADAARLGMKRTFACSGETIQIEQHPVKVEEIRAIAAGCGLRVVFAAERAIDESVWELFESANAVEKFEQCKGLRLVFGVHVTPLLT